MTPRLSLDAPHSYPIYCPTGKPVGVSSTVLDIGVSDVNRQGACVREPTISWGSQLCDSVLSTHPKGNHRGIPRYNVPSITGHLEEEVMSEPRVQVGGSAGRKRGVSMEKQTRQRRPHQARRCEQQPVAKSMVSPEQTG